MESAEEICRKLLDCTICLFKFDTEHHTAHVLQCGHTVCRLCIVEVARNENKDEIPCPFCKADCAMQEKYGPLGFPKNFTICDMVEGIEKKNIENGIIPEKVVIELPTIPLGQSVPLSLQRPPFYQKPTTLRRRVPTDFGYTQDLDVILQAIAEHRANAQEGTLPPDPDEEEIDNEALVNEFRNAWRRSEYAWVRVSNGHDEVQDI